MEKQKKSVGTIALVVLLLIVTVAALVLATYAWAKYTTTAPQQTATANVAKWNVSFDYGGTFTQNYTHVSTGTIAPGTSGEITIQPVPGSTETCFDYTIHMDKFVLMNGDSEMNPDDVIKASDGTNAAVKVSDVLGHISLTCGSVNFKTTDLVGSYDLSGTTHNGASGSLQNKSTGATFSSNVYTITWNWPYDDGSDNAAYDRIDTALGEYAAQTGNDIKLKVNYTCKATQTNTSYDANHAPNV